MVLKLKKDYNTLTWYDKKQEEERLLLTVTSFKGHASCDAVNDEEADDMTAIILNEAFELLDLLLDWVPYVLLSLRLHIHIWGVDS